MCVTTPRLCLRQNHLQGQLSSSSPRIAVASRSWASCLAASRHSARVSLFPEGREEEPKEARESERPRTRGSVAVCFSRTLSVAGIMKLKVVMKLVMYRQAIDGLNDGTWSTTPGPLVFQPRQYWLGDPLEKKVNSTYVGQPVPHRSRQKEGIPMFTKYPHLR